jgi:hypothetical protein
MFKKTSLAHVLGAVALLTSGVIMADAPSKDLIVKGIFEIPGCAVAQTEGGIYDYGSIPASMIKSGAATTTLEPKKQTWTVDCDAATYLSFTIEDNQTDSISHPSDRRFGLGMVNDTGKIGYYQVKLSNPQVDGGSKTYVKVVQKGLSSGNGHDPVDLYRPESFVYSWSPSAANDSQLSASRTFVMDMEVTPTLAGTTTMNGPVTENVPLNGSLTISYAFGL